MAKKKTKGFDPYQIFKHGTKNNNNTHTQKNNNNLKEKNE